MHPELDRQGEKIIDYEALMYRDPSDPLDDCLPLREEVMPGLGTRINTKGRDRIAMAMNMAERKFGRSRILLIAGFIGGTIFGMIVQSVRPSSASYPEIGPIVTPTAQRPTSVEQSIITIQVQRAGREIMMPDPITEIPFIYVPSRS